MPVQNESKNLNRIFNMIARLKPKPDFVVFCENDSKDNTLSLLQDYAKTRPNVKVLNFSMSFAGDCWDSIAHARQLLLEEARQLDCDFTVFLDADVNPISFDFMAKLSGHNVDLCGSNVKEFMEFENNGKITFQLLPDCMTGSPQTGFYPVPLLSMPLTEVYCFGFHAACLSRKLVQDTRLNLEPILPVYTDVACEDYSFCHQAQILGYSVYVDNTAKFNHLRDKQKRGWRISEQET
jgi:glycosyltransferase involved in cell wall biosynthesis